jgi:hypothetical protein
MLLGSPTIGLHDPVALLTIVVAVMVLLGFGNNALELRRQPRRCGSCGRRLKGRRCPGCAPHTRPRARGVR